MIDILVTGNPRWLPPAEGFGPKLLKPGANKLKPDHWQAVKNHPGVVALLKNKTIRENPPATVVREHSHAPDPVSGLSDLTIEKAEPWITACDDQALLISWRKSDRRKSILKLIDDRLSELAE